MSEGSDGIAPTKSLIARFTKRDLILYALGIGCCSNDDEGRNDRELRYAYENHPNFAPFPTFLLALAFTAERQEEGQPRFGTFPPESMTNYLEDGTSCGILPKQFFKDEGDAREARDLPILHMSQRLVMHAEIDLSGGTNQDEPTQMQLRARVISVKPRSIGTFVTTETTYHQNGRHIATAQMVALILGLDPDAVVHKERIDEPSQRIPPRRVVPEDRKYQEKTLIQYRIPKTAALLYRLSGDYNPIHVEGMLGSSGHQSDRKEQKIAKKGPVLHGLCTLGYAVRAVMHHIDQTHHAKSPEIRVVSVRCNFTKPVYVGDALRVEIWNESRSSAGFCVYRGDDAKEHSDLVVDKGQLQFRIKRLSTDTMDTVVSRL